MSDNAYFGTRREAKVLNGTPGFAISDAFGSAPAWEALRRAYEEHGLIVGLVAERARGGDDGVEELAER